MKELIQFLNKFNVEFTVQNDTVIVDNIDLSHTNLTSLPESFGNIKCNRINLNDNQFKNLLISCGNVKSNLNQLDYNQLVIVNQ